MNKTSPFLPTNLEVLIFLRPGDKERIREFLDNYLKMTPAQLIDAYNSAWRLGIVGNQMQTLSYLALHYAFQKVFGKSPITIDGGNLLGLTNPIYPDGEKWKY